MKLEFRESNLLSFYLSVPLVQSISADFAMSAGLSKQIDTQCGVKEELLASYSNYADIFRDCHFDGDCLASNSNKIFNLITRASFYDKPSLKSLEASFSVLHRLCKENGIKKLAMPCLGCGNGKLKWSEVSQLLYNEFNASDIEFIVCYADKKILMS